MQVSIARQLQLQPTTVGNFFMNARRRLHDKWDSEMEDDDVADLKPGDEAAHLMGQILVEEANAANAHNNNNNSAPNSTAHTPAPSITDALNNTPLPQLVSQQLPNLGAMETVIAANHIELPVGVGDVANAHMAQVNVNVSGFLNVSAADIIATVATTTPSSMDVLNQQQGVVGSGGTHTLISHAQLQEQLQQQAAEQQLIEQQLTQQHQQLDPNQQLQLQQPQYSLTPL